MSRKIEFQIPKEYDNQTVKSFLRYEKHVSAKLLIKLKASPTGLLCNGEHIRSIDLLHEGDLLSIEFPDESNVQTSAYLSRPLSVIYQDEDILVINKPGDIAMHESHNHQGDTLSNMVSYHLFKQGKKSLFRSVGRLDKGTSGVIVCALHAYAAARLSGKIQKEYLAVVPGLLGDVGTIDKPIYRPDPMKTLRATGPDGEIAVTHWNTLLHTKDQNSLVAVHLETGRTHQIRVHFQSIGHPLIGDDMYGGTTVSTIHRQALHCATCKFKHPITEKALTFYAPIPNDFQSLL